MSSTLRTPLSRALQTALPTTTRLPLRTLHTTAVRHDAPKKQQITLRSGDPSTRPWSDLNAKQKVVRSATNSASFLTIIVGMVVTGGVLTLVYREVMAPDSVTAWFNRSVDRVKQSPECMRLLGEGRIKAYGEPTANRWAKARPIAANHTRDNNGTEHLLISFNVQGSLERGVVKAHMVKRPGETDYRYWQLQLDVEGEHPGETERRQWAGEMGGNV